MEFSSEERASQQQNPEGGRERNERPSHQTDGESRTYSPQMRTVEDQTKRSSDARNPHGIPRAECHSTGPDDDKLSTSPTSTGTKYTSELCPTPTSTGTKYTSELYSSDNPNKRPSVVQSVRTIAMHGDADDLDPPDGGWGWVVCATAMLTGGTITGFLNTLSLVYVAILRRFRADEPNIATKTSHVVSMVVLMTYLMCSVGGVLGDVFGIRQVAFAGGFLAFVGALSSAFVTELMLLYLTFGVLLGVGFAFCLSQSMVIVSHYFKKRIGLVYSLMSFGGASFAVIFSLTIPWISDNFGLERMLFCLSGLNALLMVYALTWKPLIIPRQSMKKANLVARKESMKTGLGTLTARTNTVGDASYVSFGRQGGNNITSKLVTTSTQKTEEVGDNVKNMSSVSDEKILYRSASCISGQALKHKNGAHAQTQERQWDKNDRCCCGLVKRKIWRNTSYIIWTVGSMIGATGFVVGLTHMVKFAIDIFPDSDSKFLPITYGVTMTMTRLLFGSIADKPIVVKHYIPIHQAVFVTMGTITMCLPSVESFEVVLVCAMLIGVCDGMFFLLLGPITVHLVDAQDASQAMGFYFGLIALPLSAGPSLAGFMYDRYGSYDVAFRVLGVPCIVGALLMTLIPFFGKKNKTVDFADKRHT